MHHVLPADAFIANEAHWFTLDVVYLVFVRGGSVAGGRVGGQLAGAQFSGSSNDPRAYAKASLLQRYLSLDPFAPGFLQFDRKNFLYTSADLREAHISERRALWTGDVPNSGVVTLTPRAGRRRRLILLGQQDLNAVRSLLTAGGVPISPV